jgi:peptide/nickel transport system substrate-binding protein
MNGEARSTWAGLLLLTVSVAFLGCMPSASGPASGSIDQASSTRIKTMTIAVDRDQERILTRIGRQTPEVLRDSTHQHLAIQTPGGAVLPQLAVELPATSRGTWIVRPDGTMQTTYQIHPNVTWHDGAPLTTRDFVFAWTVVMDPALPIESRAAAQQIERIDPKDDHAFVIEWKRPYASANAIVEDDIGPFPTHLLQSGYEANKEQFWLSPWWGREFIGVGPYRIVGWEPGSHVSLEAYDGFYAGRAKIDRITVRIIRDNPQAILANLLAGAVDWSEDVTFTGAVILKREWEQTGLRPTFITHASSGRALWIQYHEPAARDLLDVRVRRGLLHALDRRELGPHLEGLNDIMETLLPPDDVRWAWVKDDIVRYPHDVRRADALFAEAGLHRGPDGVFANTAGARVVLPLWNAPGPASGPDSAIIGDRWKSFGVLTEQTLMSEAQADDRQYRVSFPALLNSSWPLPTVASLQRLQSNQCPSEQNRWTGQNYGCYGNPAMDQIVVRLTAAVDPEDQRRPFQELAVLYSQELPLLPLYWGIGAIIARQGVTGVKGVGDSATWNIAEWDID